MYSPIRMLGEIPVCSTDSVNWEGDGTHLQAHRVLILFAVPFSLCWDGHKIGTGAGISSKESFMLQN